MMSGRAALHLHARAGDAIGSGARAAAPAPPPAAAAAAAAAEEPPFFLIKWDN